VAEAGTQYLNDQNDCPGLIPASFLYDNLGEYTVIDLRAVSAYEAGHIPGARPSTLGTLVQDLAGIPADKPYVLVCYTGHVSSQAKLAMEMLGYEDVKFLLFGMSAWNSSLDSWTVHCQDYLANPETTDQNGNMVWQGFPALEGDPGTIVQERVAHMLEQGYRGISYPTMADNLEEYFIINYFGEADYLGEGSAGVPGHIPGAFQFTPYASLGMDQMLGYIPTDRPVVVYDWTGMQSPQVTAYLTMLGYEAFSLNFGCNSLFYSDLLVHRWTPAAMNDFPLEVGPPSPAPDDLPAVAVALDSYPNPFNPATTVAFTLEEPATVRLEVFDLQGRLVRGLLRGEAREAGSHAAVWNGKDDQGRALPSGAYLCRLTAGGTELCRRMTLLK
jgi:rhodanese-related sulfurtransferase